MYMFICTKHRCNIVSYRLKD